MAVPVFMCTSFFLTTDIYLNQNNDGLKKRMARLYMPLALWSGIYFVFRSIYAKELLIRGLLMELLFGNSGDNNPVFWFNMVQIYITVLLWCIFCLQKRWGIRAAEGMMLAAALVAFIWQITGMNDKVFTESVLLELRCTWNRISGMFLFAVAGMEMSLRKDKIVGKMTWVYALTVFVLVNVLFEASGLEAAWYYEIRLLLCGAALTCFFIFVPLPENRVVLFLSRYSFGVYCMHMLVGKIFGNLFASMNGTVRSLCVYIICIGIALILDRCGGRRVRILVC